VFDHDWQLVALHHSATPHGNEGIWINAIIDGIRATLLAARTVSRGVRTMSVPGETLDDYRRYVVSITHASADAWTARQIQKEIAGRGARTFLSQLDAADESRARGEIENALNQAQECVVLYTPDASDWS
jgi:hypothetical protein